MPPRPKRIKPLREADGDACDEVPGGMPDPEDWLAEERVLDQARRNGDLVMAPAGKERWAHGEPR